MLQTRTVEPGTLELLKRLMSMSIVEPFFLVGGTALALQWGHRISVDLDLFSPEPFDKETLIETLATEFDLSIESETTNMVISYINGVKVDFVKMSYPVLYPPLIVEGVRMLDIKDIAPMKLKAVVQRGSKKDFFDIYFLLRHMPLEKLLGLFKKKFKQHETFHVVKSLLYFDDAEDYPDPVLFNKKITWGLVKSTVGEAVRKLVQ